MNEADIPIDIHIAKLLEWLVSRRIVSKTPQEPIHTIRNKIMTALKDLPAHNDLITLLSGAYINYFHCSRIIEILKQTEENSKNVFGSYGSQRMKDWFEIIKLYEKQNVYLAEASQILVRSISYEIPCLKKQVTRLETQHDDIVRKAQELAKSELVLSNEYVALCSQLGVKGENLEEELLPKFKDLPAIYSKSIQNISDLQPIVNYYTSMCNADRLPITRYLIEYGNTTVFQYQYKRVPTKIEEPVLCLNFTNIGSRKNNFSAEQDSGEHSTSSEIQIDCAQTEENENDSLEDIAKGALSFTLLDSPNHREQFLDELHELEAFLKLRLFELVNGERSHGVSYLLLNFLSMHDKASITQMIGTLEELLRHVNNEKTQSLHQLKHSPTYAAIVASKLDQKLKAIEKNRLTQNSLNLKASELSQAKQDAVGFLEKIKRQTKVLQSQIEMDISKRYKNRSVNLLGGSGV